MMIMTRKDNDDLDDDGGDEDIAIFDDNIDKDNDYLVSDDYLDIDDYLDKDNDYLDFDDHHSLLGVGVLAASLKVATTAL